MSKRPITPLCPGAQKLLNEWASGGTVLHVWETAASQSYSEYHVVVRFASTLRFYRLFPMSGVYQISQDREADVSLECVDEERHCEHCGGVIEDNHARMCLPCRSLGPHYQVIVGNIGTVHDGNDHDEAHSEYEAYVELSVSGYGRASGEEVTLMEDDEPLVEHYGTRHDEDMS